MDIYFLNQLGISELEELRKYLTSSDDASKKVIEVIDKQILYKKDVVSGEINFSSDRIPNYKEENKGRCLELLNEIKLGEVSFFNNALYVRSANKAPLSLEKVVPGLGSDKITLMDFELFFSDPYNRFYHESAYNTYNYLKNYIYYLLSNDNNLNKYILFEGLEEKKSLASKLVVEIAEYLLEIERKTPDLYLSVGNQGLAATLRRTDVNKPLSFHQKRLIDAVSFGTSIDKLENRDFKDSERLLFIPKRRYRK